MLVCVCQTLSVRMQACTYLFLVFDHTYWGVEHLCYILVPSEKPCVASTKTGWTTFWGLNCLFVMQRREVIIFGTAFSLKFAVRQFIDCILHPDAKIVSIELVFM
jgi:hypothetical protein